MIEAPEHKPLSRDDRDEIAAVAAAAARRNRPVHLVVAACVLLVGSLAMAGSAYLSRLAAARALDRYALENQYAKAYIEKITELRAQAGGRAGSDLPGVNDPVPTILRQIQEQAAAAGLSVPAPAESNVAISNTPYTRRELLYTFTSDSIDKVFAWVTSVGERLPGTEVYSISLTPIPASRSWSVRLAFARFERAAPR